MIKLVRIIDVKLFSIDDIEKSSEITVIYKNSYFKKFDFFTRNSFNREFLVKSIQEKKACIDKIKIYYL